VITIKCVNNETLSLFSHLNTYAKTEVADIMNKNMKRGRNLESLGLLKRWKWGHCVDRKRMSKRHRQRIPSISSNGSFP